MQLISNTFSFVLAEGTPLEKQRAIAWIEPAMNRIVDLLGTNRSSRPDRPFGDDLHLEDDDFEYCV